MNKMIEELKEVFLYLGFKDWEIDLYSNTDNTVVTVAISKSFNPNEPKQFLGQLDESIKQSEHQRDIEAEHNGYLLELNNKLEAATLEVASLRRYRDHFDLELLLRHGRQQ